MEDNNDDGSQEKKEVLRDQDRFLPITNLVRIMKKNLPPDAKISKDSKECIQDIASEFISFVSSEAADVCAEQKRKTINGEDIYTAMERLGFGVYLRPVKEFFNNKRDNDAEEGSSPPTPPSNDGDSNQ